MIYNWQTGENVSAALQIYDKATGAVIKQPVFYYDTETGRLGRYGAVNAVGVPIEVWETRDCFVCDPSEAAAYFAGLQAQACIVDQADKSHPVGV